MSLRSAAAKVLQECIEAHVPDLLGKVHVYHALPQEAAHTPCLAILPGAMEFMPEQEDELGEEDTSKGLFRVGELQGTWELRLLAASAPQREKLEDAILDAFFQREGAVGVIAATVPDVMVRGVKTGYDATASFLLDREIWQEEFVFSQKRWTWIDVAVEIPVLVLRDRVFDIDTLRTALTEDMTTTDAAQIPIEEVTIGEDGSTTKV